jgi:hypothetical protein
VEYQKDPENRKRPGIHERGLSFRHLNFIELEHFTVTEAVRALKDVIEIAGAAALGARARPPGVIDQNGLLLRGGGLCHGVSP